MFRQAFQDELLKLAKDRSNVPYLETIGGHRSIAKLQQRRARPKPPAPKPVASKPAPQPPFQFSGGEWKRKQRGLFSSQEKPRKPLKGKLSQLQSMQVYGPSSGYFGRKADFAPAGPASKAPVAKQPVQRGVKPGP